MIRPLFRFRRFSRKLMLLFAGLIAVVQLSVYVLVADANRANAIDHIQNSLEIGARIFRQNLNERIQSLSTSAQLVSGDYAIKPLLIQDSDRATLASTLRSFSERLHAPVIALFTPEGSLLAATDDALGLEMADPVRRLIAEAAQAESGQASGYCLLGGRLHVLVAVPLYAPYPEVAGWFGLPFPMDDAFAQAMKDTTLLELTFARDGPGDAGRVLHSTLPTASAAQLGDGLSLLGNGQGGVGVITLRSEPYVTLTQPLPLIDGSPARVILQRSLTAELAPARRLEKVVLGISLAAVLAAFGGAWWLARGVSEPLRQLAEHTRHVAAGDNTRFIELPRADELGQLATAFNQMTRGLADRDRVRSLLGKVVSPEIAAQLLQSDLRLGGEEREVTILFCDLRNFTGLSESLEPTAILALLNRYLDRMSAIIEQHGGVIDKYIGDAIMALFGAPVAGDDAADRAVAAARAMTAALADLNRELASEGRPPLAFGIGINTARVVAGNMGSRTRLNYTVIGDGVNLAARLEALTKEPAFATPIMLSEGTRLALRNPPPLRSLGEVRVRGKIAAVPVYACPP